MKNGLGSKNYLILTNTFGVILCISLCALPVIWLFAFGTNNSQYIFYIRLGLFLLSLILWGIFSSIDIFKESKIKAILRLILVLALVLVIGYISYVTYLTSGR